MAVAGKASPGIPYQLVDGELKCLGDKKDTVLTEKDPRKAVRRLKRGEKVYVTVVYNLHQQFLKLWEEECLGS